MDGDPRRRVAVGRGGVVIVIVRIVLLDLRRMNDGVGHVFISYKTEDREQARKVRAALALSIGGELRWDQDLQAGGRWAADLDAAVTSAACVVVLWSPSSVASPWVLQEAAIAKALGKLVPVCIGSCEIPEPYREIHNIDLSNWNGREDDPEFVRLAKGVRAHLKAPKPNGTPDSDGAPESDEPPPPDGSPAWLGRMARYFAAGLVGTLLGTGSSLMMTETNAEGQATRGAIDTEEVKLRKDLSDTALEIRKEVLRLQACLAIPNVPECNEVTKSLADLVERIEERLKEQEQ